MIKKDKIDPRPYGRNVEFQTFSLKQLETAIFTFSWVNLADVNEKAVMLHNKLVIIFTKQSNLNEL